MEEKKDTAEVSNEKLHILIAVIITALVVGGGMYFWNSSSTPKVEKNTVVENSLPAKNGNIINPTVTIIEKAVESPSNYTNTNDGYRLTVPTTHNVVFQCPVAECHIVKFEKEIDNYFTATVKVGRKIAYLFDYEPTEEITAGNYTWTRFDLTKGYCDGGGDQNVCSKPRVVFVVYKDGKNYIVDFYNKTGINREIIDVLNSFKLL